MCGIVGWYRVSNTSLDRSHLLQLQQTLRHRGPDDSGSFVDESRDLALGHNRLSIIDLSPGGHQPMVHPDTGDVLIFNGEIYNFKSLRPELEALGVRFRSESDSEILLHALTSWGSDGLHRVRGMYAFALWRPKDRVLLLGRDPMGIKPLYHWLHPDGGIVFASEVKAFLDLPGFSRRMDRAALRQFLEFGYGFEPTRTILAGVNKLPPGHILRLGPAGLDQPERFFKPDLHPDEAKSAEDWEEELRAALGEVVAEHLVADVPVALLLSGGLDSSLLAALAAKSAQLNTLTMGFADSQIDERSPAQTVASYIGSGHTDILIRPEEIRSDLETTVACFDDLFADWGTISTRLLFRKAQQQGIKAVLVGEGADELFGGYSIFRHGERSAGLELWLARLYRAYCGRRYGRLYGKFRNTMQRYLRETDGDRFAAIRLFETRNQLPNNYLMKVDKASMAVSVEARAPYLDQRIAEIAYRIPSKHLLSPDSEKIILRRIAERFHLLPECAYARPKFGAGIAASWMDDSEEFRNYAQEIILAPDSWTHALGLRRAMSEFFLRGRRGYPFPHSISIFRDLAWRLLALELWSRRYGISAHGD
jgi:asparagine synthase (glutamine-hydrolysing)